MPPTNKTWLRPSLVDCQSISLVAQTTMWLSSHFVTASMTNASFEVNLDRDLQTLMHYSLPCGLRSREIPERTRTPRKIKKIAMMEKSGARKKNERQLLRKMYKGTRALPFSPSQIFSDSPDWCPNLIITKFNNNGAKLGVM